MTSAEDWRPVVGWEGIYEVSNLGRVHSLPHPTKTGTRGGQILKQRTRSDYGYQVVDLVDAGRYSTRAVHTLVADAFIPNPQFYPLVRHLDGNPANNHAINLGWGTYVMNAADAQRHGTMPIAHHGSASKYQSGCRCPACTAANTAASARYRARKKENA